MKKQFIINALLAICLSQFLFNSCQHEDATLQLNVSMDSLSIQSTDTVNELTLSTTPRGKINYTITQKPSWLSIDKMSGSSSGDNVILKIRPVLSNLGLGQYNGKVSIITDVAGTRDVYVCLQVKTSPKLKTNLTSITFPENSYSSDLILENSGVGYLYWSMGKSSDWLTLSSNSGYLNTGQKTTVRITVNRDYLEENSYSANIAINSTSEKTPLVIPVTMKVPRITALKVGNPNILFDYDQITSEVYLKNAGNTTVNWSVTPKSYYTVNPNNGTLNKKDSVKLTITLDRSAFQTGTFTSDIPVSSIENAQTVIHTTINHLATTKWTLDRNVIDADFCRNTNRIVIASGNPNRLSVIDPETQSIQSVDLGNIPKCISVNKNGDHAIVGSDKQISLVNLNTMTVEKNWSISCSALSVVLTTNNWVYVFPQNGGWEGVHCINLQTGTETVDKSTWIYGGGATGRIHPSEKYIYITDCGTSSHTLLKCSANTGVSNLIYAAPNVGNFPINGNLWFSEDGDRIFTGGKTVFRSSDVISLDMAVNGTVSCSGSIRSLFHSKTTGQFFLIANNSDWYYGYRGNPEVLCYNYSDLNYVRTYPLEPFVNLAGKPGGKLCKAEGNFIYVNKAGTKMYVITKAESSSAISNKWAIQKMDIH